MSRSQHLFLLREMVKRDFQARYAGSALGFLWSLLQPLWTLLLFTFVFATVLKIRPIGERTDNFAIFLFSGLIAWMAISEALTRATTAITDNAELVKKLRFPAELLIVSIVLGALVHAGIAAVLFLVVLAVVGELQLSGLPLLLVALPLQVAMTIGIGMMLSSVHVLFRDTAQLVSMFLNGWFYFTPIVYSLGFVPDRFRAWIEANPLTPLVGLYRAAFLGGSLKDAGDLLPLVLAAVLAATLGYALFQRLETTFADDI